MKQRGRPRLIRPVGEKVHNSGLRIRQILWIKRNYKHAGYTSAAHYLRSIVDEYIELDKLKDKRVSTNARSTAGASE